MRKRFNTTNSFLDVLFNILLGFFLLFVIAIMLVNPPTNNRGNTDLKAEFLITMEWPGDDDSDIDLLLKTPSKEVVFYGNPNGDAASLDRDDQGSINDTIILSDGTKQRIEQNWEHIAIRKTTAGKYTANILMFAKRSKKPTPVTVKIEKLNPYKLIYSTTIQLNTFNQEETILTFKMDNKGNILSLSNAPARVTDYIRGNGP